MGFQEYIDTVGVAIRENPDAAEVYIESKEGMIALAQDIGHGLSAYRQFAEVDQEVFRSVIEGFYDEHVLRIIRVLGAKSLPVPKGEFVEYVEAGFCKGLLALPKV